MRLLGAAAGKRLTMQKNALLFFLPAFDRRPTAT